MVEHTAHIDYEKLLYDRSESTLKVHGILSIIFGSLGTLAAVVMMMMLIASTYADPTYDSVNSPFGLFVVGAMVFVFWTLPHIYLIISGYYLMREPAPKVAKTLIIINLVIGVFWNLVLLIFAIINLTQLSDYARGYHVHKKK
jgi:small-conductance mechanosensitive channel